MYKIQYTSRMKHDVKRMKRRGKDLSKLLLVLSALSQGKELPARNRDHPLSGDLKDFRECHIEPDWLLLYQVCDDTLILTATATGTHSDLLGM